MDYSLLLVVIDRYNIDIEQNEDLEKIYKDPSLIRRIFTSQNNRYIYCIGIIDYLQKYNFKKKFEHKFKYIFHKNNASAVDSKLYSLRMYKFLSTHLLDNFKLRSDSYRTASTNRFS